MSAIFILEVLFLSGHSKAKIARKKRLENFKIFDESSFHGAFFSTNFVVACGKPAGQKKES